MARLTSRVVRETRDELVRAGATEAAIDQFVAEIVNCTPAVAESVCRAWREKCRRRAPAAGRQVKAPGSRRRPSRRLPQEKPGACRAETAAECERCPAGRFLACLMGEREPCG
ncbi:MAG: hypothetical protein JRI59_05995 [Deltaproteobacteria bacterium]|nr:hypothetical protein [Deltaproteobacteria bacterium]